MDKTEKAKEVYKNLETKYGIKKSGDRYGLQGERYEMDLEKVSESLGVKVVEASFKSADQLETSFENGTNSPMLSFSNFVIHVDDQSMRENRLVPKFSVQSDEDIVVIFDSFGLYEEESGAGVSISFLCTLWSGNGPEKSLSRLSFSGFTLELPESNKEYAIDCTKMNFGAFSLAQFPPSQPQSDSLKTAEAKTFMEFVMGVLEMGSHNLLGVYTEFRMENARFPLSLCGVSHELLAREVLVNREKGCIVLRDPCLRGSDARIASRLTIEVSKDTHDIKITSEDASAISYERVYELWKILDEHFLSVRKTVNFTFEQLKSDQRLVVALPNDAFAEVSGLKIETALGDSKSTKVSIGLRRAYLRRAIGPRKKLVATASYSERSGGSGGQAPCITLNVNSGEGCNPPNVLREEEFKFNGGSGTNAEAFAEACKGCKYVVCINLTSFSAQTLDELRAIFRDIVQPDSDATVFTALSVRKSFMLYTDPTRYVTSKKPSVVYARSSTGEGARGAYLACFSDLNLYMGSPSDSGQYVAAFHSLPVEVSRDIPVEIYSDSDSLFVAAEGTALLVCPETLNKIFDGGKLTGKRRIVAKLESSSLKLCNRIKARETPISATVVSAKTITISSEKPPEDEHPDDRGDDTALNVQSKVTLEIADAELYTVGLFNNIGLPRTKGQEVVACSTPSDFWSGLGFLRFGSFEKVLVTVILATPRHCSLGVSVDSVVGLEMEFYPDTLFPLLDIFRCLMNQTKVLVGRWKLKCPQDGIASKPPERLQSKKFIGLSGQAADSGKKKSPSPPQPATYSTVPNPQQYPAASGYCRSNVLGRKPSSLGQDRNPLEKKGFRVFNGFAPSPDYHDGSITGVAYGVSKEGAPNEDPFFEDLRYTEISIRVKEIDEFTLRFKFQNAMKSGGGSFPNYKGSESKIYSYADSIPDSADIYYRSNLLPKEAYWFGNIVLMPSSETQGLVTSSSSSSSSQGESKSEKDVSHMFAITIQKGYFNYTFINDKFLKDVPAKKRVYMWFDKFTAKYDDKLVGESRGDKFRPSYIPGPTSPYVTFFMSFVVPSKPNGEESMCNSEGNLSIYINPCYVSFMQDMFSMFDKYTDQKEKSALSETPFSKSITHITLHPFVLNFDWVALKGWVSFKNVVTETQFVSFNPKEHSWGSVLREIINHMKEKYIIEILNDSLTTGTDNPICSVARIYKCAKDAVVRPVRGANQGARNVFMGIIEGAWELTCTVFEESVNMGTMVCKSFYTLYQMGMNYYTGNNNGDAGSNNDGNVDDDGNSNGRCTKLFMSLPFGIQKK